MLKLNQNYSDYTDETDTTNYPEGKAINATSSESVDGTPLLASFMNDVNGAHIAMYEKAYGNRTGISGNADTQKASQFADAVAKYTDDKVKEHADERGLADNVHGATEEATPGQIASRDDYGNLQVGTAINDADAINKGDVEQMFTDADLKAGAHLDVDTVVTEDSENLITSGGVNDALTDYYTKEEIDSRNDLIIDKTYTSVVTETISVDITKYQFLLINSGGKTKNYDIGDAYPHMAVIPITEDISTKSIRLFISNWGNNGVEVTSITNNSITLTVLLRDTNYNVFCRIIGIK